MTNILCILMSLPQVSTIHSSIWLWSQKCSSASKRNYESLSGDTLNSCVYRLSRGSV